MSRAYYGAVPLDRLAAAGGAGNDTEASLVLGERYLAAGRAADAETVLSRLVEQTPGLGNAWLLRARAELAQGKDGPAYASGNVAVSILGSTAEGLTLLGQLEERRGNENRGEEQYRQALRVDPRFPEAHYRLGRLELSHLHYGAAMGHLEEVRRARPRDAETVQLLAQCHRELGQTVRAQALAREAVRLAPGSARASFMLGSVLKGDADPSRRAEAETAFRRALELDPGMASARHEIGASLFQREDYSAAASELERVVRELPLNKPSYQVLAQCYQRLQRPADAARVLAEYRKLDEMDLSTAPVEYSLWAMPDNVPLRIKLARLYLKYGRPDLAESQTSIALEKNPRYRPALELSDRLRKERR